MYYAGLGTAADKPKALKYLIESAEQGNTQAKRIVAQELISGEYIPQDIQRGIIMLTEYADKGDMYWLEATEIHPELRNDLATEVGVE